MHVPRAPVVQWLKFRYAPGSSHAERKRPFRGFAKFAHAYCARGGTPPSEPPPPPHHPSKNSLACGAMSHVGEPALCATSKAARYWSEQWRLQPYRRNVFEPFYLMAFRWFADCARCAARGRVGVNPPFHYGTEPYRPAATIPPATATLFIFFSAPSSNVSPLGARIASSLA
jgi:hypothetical protein